MTPARNLNSPPPAHPWEYESRLLDYLEDHLPVAERQTVEDHLAVCPECRILCQQWKKLDAALALGMSRPQLSPEFNTRLWQRVQAEAVPGRSPVNLQRQQMEAEFQARLVQLRKDFLPLSKLVEEMGYTAVAAVAAYFLIQAFAGFFASRVDISLWPGANLALFLVYAPAAVCLLVGLAFALNRQVARWWAML